MKYTWLLLLFAAACAHHGPTKQTTSTADGTGASGSLAFSTQPSDGTVDAPIAQVAVQVLDASGAPVMTAVAVTLASDDASYSSTAMSAGGEATFASVHILAVGSHTLTASADGYTSATSNAFTIARGAPAKLMFTQLPSQARAKVAQATPTLVVVQDSSGNMLGDGIQVALTLSGGTQGATLSGTTTVATTGGTATFAGLAIDLMGTAYTYVAAVGGSVMATSDPFDVGPGLPDHLSFVQQPTSPQSAGIASENLIIEIDDAAGNRVTDSDISITLDLAAGPSGGYLLSAGTFPDTSGVLSLQTGFNLAGSGYQIRASASGLGQIIGHATTVVAGAEQMIVFTQQPPATATAGLPFAITAALEDGYGNVVDTDSATQLTLTTGLGAAVGNGGPVTAASGVVSFANVTLTGATPTTQLTTSAGSLTAAFSNVFAVNDAGASTLTFYTQPSSTRADTELMPVRVALTDAYGNTVTEDSSTPITVSVASGPGAVTGTTTVVLTNGLAQFVDLHIFVAATGYALGASGGGFTLTSSPFDVTGGSPVSFSFVAQPTNTVVDEPITPAVVVSMIDAYGNISNDPSVQRTLTIDRTTGGDAPGHGTLHGDTQEMTVAGFATFSNLSLDYANDTTREHYALSASDGQLQPVTSNMFDVTFGPSGRICYVQNNWFGFNNGQSEFPFTSLVATQAPPYGPPCVTLRLRVGDGTTTGADSGFVFAAGQTLERDSNDSTPGTPALAGTLQVTDGVTVSGPFNLANSPGMPVFTGTSVNGLVLQNGLTVATGAAGVVLYGSPQGLIHIGGLTVTNATANAVDLPSATASYVLDNVSLSAVGAAAVNVQGGTLSITGTSSLSVTNGSALSIDNAAIGTVDLASVVVSGNTTPIVLYGVTSASGNNQLNVNGGSLVVSGAPAVSIVGGSVNVQVLADVQAPLVLTVSSGHSGTVLFSSGTITADNAAGVSTAPVYLNGSAGSYAFSGPFSASGGAISVVGASGGSLTLGAGTTLTQTSFSVVSSSANVTMSGSLDTTASGQVIFIYQNTGGLIDFGGSVNATATGFPPVYFANNSGPTLLRFNGTLNAQSDSDVFVASNGGSVEITGAANLTVTGTGAAVNMQDVNIGPNGMQVQNIAASGSPATSLIVLVDTGSGAFTLTGTGTPGSGASLSGINSFLFAENAGAISLSNVIAAGVTESFVSLNTATSLSIGNSTLSQCGGAGFDCLSLSNIGGVDLEQLELAAPGANGVNIGNNANDLLMTATVNIHDVVSGKDALVLDVTGTNQTVVSVTGSRFANIAGGTSLSAFFRSTATLTFDDNQVTAASGSSNGGGLFLTGVSGNVQFHVGGNTFTNVDMNGFVNGAVINVLGENTTSMNGTIDGNTLNGAPDSYGIGIAMNDTSSLVTNMTNNTFAVGAGAIEIVGRDSTSVQAFIAGNVVASYNTGPSVTGAGGIVVESDGQSVCLAMSNNSVANVSLSDYELFQISPVTFTFEESPDTAASGQLTSGYFSSLGNSGTFSALGSVTLSDGVQCQRASF